MPSSWHSYRSLAYPWILHMRLLMILFSFRGSCRPLCYLSIKELSVAVYYQLSVYLIEQFPLWICLVQCFDVFQESHEVKDSVLDTFLSIVSFYMRFSFQPIYLPLKPEFEFTLRQQYFWRFFSNEWFASFDIKPPFMFWNEAYPLFQSYDFSSSTKY